MRFLKGMIAGAIAAGSLVLAEAPALAHSTTAPEMIQVSTVQPGSVLDQTTPCYYYGYHQHFYGYHRHFYGYHRPFYGYHRHYYGYRRPIYGYPRPFGYHRFRPLYY